MTDIAALIERLRKAAIRLEFIELNCHCQGVTGANEHSCELCGAKWEHGYPEPHRPNCIAALDEAMK